MPNIAINGFGRIGRLTLRAAVESAMESAAPCHISHINDLAAPQTLAHLFKYDSVHGTFQGEVSADDDSITLNGHRIKVTQSANPQELPWGAENIGLVLECSGIFTARDTAAGHLQAGARKVIVSAPCDKADATVVYGINHEILTADDDIISNASCTTNCLAPLAYVLDKQFGILQGFMTTVHSYTGDQSLLDASHKSLLRARAAATSMVPSTTGAAKSIGLVLPQLKGKLDGTAVRVPTPNVSLVNLVVDVENPTDKKTVNQAFVKAAKSLSNILAVSDVPLVSVDYNHDSHSSIVDLNETYVNGNMVRLLAWYDNEWGFSNRLIDVTRYLEAQKFL